MGHPRMDSHSLSGNSGSGPLTLDVASQHRVGASASESCDTVMDAPMKDMCVESPGHEDGSSEVGMNCSIDADTGKMPMQGNHTFYLKGDLTGASLGTLTFQLWESLDTVCGEFIAAHSLKQLFLEPLQARLELMVHMDL